MHPAPGTRRSPQPGRKPRLEPAGIQNQHDLAAEIVRVGRAERGVAHAIQREIAEEIGSSRSSVSPTLKHLAARNYIRSVGRGVWQLNPLIAYKGNGDEQQAFLYELRALALENGFPDTVGLAPVRNEDKESTAC